MAGVFIGIGSNLQGPLDQVAIATQHLSQLPGCFFRRASSYYLSKPLGPSDQPDYINRVVHLDTILSPEELLNQLQALEQQQGRVRLGRWGPRIIDLDILLYGEQVIANERLTIPHVGLKERAFFIYPLAEIAPDLILPDGEKILVLKNACSCDSIIQLNFTGEIANE